METRLGAWDCPYCGEKKRLGNVFDCSGCGRPRPRGIRFYQIPDGPIVTPEIAEQLGSGGPNWYCEHCDSGNKDNNSNCWECGAEKGSSPSHATRNYLEGEKVPESAEEAEILGGNKDSWVDEKSEPKILETEPLPNIENVAVVGAVGDERYTGWDTDAYMTVDNTSGEVIWRPLLLLGVLAAIILCIFLTYQFFFNTRYEKATVEEFYWEQSVVVQEYSVVSETSWSTYPSDAYNVVSAYLDTGRDNKVTDGWRTVIVSDTCPRSVYESKTCTGTKDNGDGSFSTYPYECGSSRTEYYPCTRTEREEIYHYEDVFDWHYQYDVNRWVTTETYTTSGLDQSPYFYDGPVIENVYREFSIPSLGQKKRMELEGKYTITFFCADNHKIGDDGYFTRDYSLEEWLKFRSDFKYEIEVNFINVILTKPVP